MINRCIKPGHYSYGLHLESPLERDLILHNRNHTPAEAHAQAMRVERLLMVIWSVMSGGAYGTIPTENGVSINIYNHRDSYQRLTSFLKQAKIACKTIGEDCVLVDVNQPNFDKTLSALMIEHRAEILRRYKDTDFIITLPDGTALDKEQVTRVITGRCQALEEDRAILNEAAIKHGVTNTVGVLARGRATASKGRTRAEGTRAEV